jgi:hypothetical protein
MLVNGCGSSDMSFLPIHQPTNQPKSYRQLDVTSHPSARNARLGCGGETDIWRCNRDCAYDDGFPVQVTSGRHCFMQLTASVVVLEQCTTTATLSPVHVPQICDHLQLILKEASSGRTLYAPQEHTMVTAAPCMHLRYTQWSLQHTAQPAITLNRVFTCLVLLSEQTAIITPKQQLDTDTCK